MQSHTPVKPPPTAAHAGAGSHHSGSADGAAAADGAAVAAESEGGLLSVVIQCVMGLRTVPIAYFGTKFALQSADKIVRSAAGRYEPERCLLLANLEPLSVDGVHAYLNARLDLTSVECRVMEDVLFTLQGTPQLLTR